MKFRVSTVRLVGLWAVAMVALLPPGSRAQPGGGGGDGGGGGAPEEGDTSDAVECAQDGTDAHYEEFLAGEGPTTVRWAASDTSCPNHVHWPINPNPAWVGAINNSIPAYPMLIENGGTIDLSMSAGGAGIMRNGVSMFTAWANVQVVEYEDSAFFQEADSFDPCGGHATPTGNYHYHGTPGCLQEQAGGAVGQHSPLLGWAMDGFPFYGQLGPGGVEMKMCGEDGADETHCLDGCMGYEAFIDEDTFAYRYYSSCGFDESFFPFTANCLRGCCPDGMTCDSKVEACTDGAEVGYSEDHVPVASESLDAVYDSTFIEGDDVDLISSTITINCTQYLGEGSLAALSSGEVGTTPSPTSVGTPATEAPEASAGAGETESPVPGIAGDTSDTEPPAPGGPEVTPRTESPVPGRAGDIPADTPAPGSGGDGTDGDAAGDGSSGASGAFGLARMVLSGAITAAVAAGLSVQGL